MITVKRPEPLHATVTGKRVKTAYYGIKQTSDYVAAAEKYMDKAEAEIELLKDRLSDFIDLECNHCALDGFDKRHAYDCPMAQD